MDKANIIIDASVIAKWMLSDEEDSPSARMLQEDFLRKAISISLPTFALYEINNLLRSAVLRQRINNRLARKAYEGFLELEFVFYMSDGLLRNTLEKALTLNISSYDASYIALSESLEIPLYTADRKLVEKAKSPLVLSLGRYPYE